MLLQDFYNLVDAFHTQRISALAAATPNVARALTDTLAAITAGTIDLTINSVSYQQAFDTSATITATAFFTAHAAALNTAGVTLTNPSAAALRFVAKVAGVTFTFVETSAGTNGTWTQSAVTANVTAIVSTLQTWQNAADEIAALLVLSDQSGSAYEFGVNDFFGVYVPAELIANPADDDKAIIAAAMSPLSIPAIYTQNSFIYYLNGIESIPQTFITLDYTSTYIKSTFALIADIPLTIDSSIVRAGDGKHYSKNAAGNAWKEITIAV